MEKIKKLYKSYGHAIPLVLYGIIYMVWFCHLERTVTRQYTVIHMSLDDRIPFCEWFVIPYFLWFAYIAAVVLFFFFKDREDYYRACVFLFTGMTVFLIVSTFWPNGHHLRPYSLPRDNVLSRLVAFLYRTDTPTNLWPSIHVYNSLGAHFAIIKSRQFENRRAVRIASFVLAASIILSTMFIKQHSVFDVLTAFGMAGIMYLVVYRWDLLVTLKNLHRTDEDSKSRIGQAAH